MAPPTADFTFNPTSGTEGLLVQFTDTSSDGGKPITSWLWDVTFNLNRGDIYTTQNPSHLYEWPATYVVKLTVTNADGSDSTTKSILVTPRGAPSYLAMFNHPTARFGGPNDGEDRAHFNTLILGEGVLYDEKFTMTGGRVINYLYGAEKADGCVLKSVKPNGTILLSANAKGNNISSKSIKPILMNADHIKTKRGVSEVV